MISGFYCLVYFIADGRNLESSIELDKGLATSQYELARTDSTMRWYEGDGAC